MGRLDICQDIVRESSVPVIVEAHIVRLVVEVRIETGDTPLDKRRAQYVAHITRQDALGTWISHILIACTRRHEDVCEVGRTLHPRGVCYKVVTPRDLVGDTSLDTIIKEVQMLRVSEGVIREKPSTLQPLAVHTRPACGKS